MRNLSAARAAFESGDSELSRLAHASPNAVCEPGHDLTEGSLEAGTVAGLAEGVLVSTVLVVVLAQAPIDLATILSLAFKANTALALGFGIKTYCHFVSKRQLFNREREREQWELENYPEGEKQEMVDLYKSQGLSEDDAKTVIGIMANYSEFFVDLMMTQELQLRIPRFNAMYNALANFAAFFVGSILPVVTFLSIATNHVAAVTTAVLLGLSTSWLLHSKLHTKVWVLAVLCGTVAGVAAAVWYIDGPDMRNILTLAGLSLS